MHQKEWIRQPGPHRPAQIGPLPGFLRQSAQAGNESATPLACLHGRPFQRMESQARALERLEQRGSLLDAFYCLR